MYRVYVLSLSYPEIESFAVLDDHTPTSSYQIDVVMMLFLEQASKGGWKQTSTWNQ